MTGSPPLIELVGQKLISVSFTIDYLQLQFEDALVNLYSFPEITVRDISFRNGDTEYRNKICELISNFVKSTDWVDDVRFVIGFETSSLVTPLDPQNNENPESVVILFSNGTTVVI